jgi:plastocyanin
MKPIVMLVALAAAGPAVSLAGCEGEPPVMAPGNPSTAPSEVASAPATASAPAAAEAPATSAPMACPPPPCMAVGSAAAAGSASAVPGASVAPAESTAALPVPPVSVPRGNIVGTVTTKPPALQGQAVVYLEDGPKEDVPSHLQSVTIANKMMNFTPYVSVVAAGGKAIFVNEDPFPHNVFSPDNEKFNMGNIPQNGAHARAFHNPGAYSLLCNLHPGMLGYLLVTPSTWASKTDAKGKFVMKHVPNGTYKISAWAPREAPVTQSVTVADGDVTVNFDLHR